MRIQIKGRTDTVYTYDELNDISVMKKKMMNNWHRKKRRTKESDRRYKSTKTKDETNIKKYNQL